MELSTDTRTLKAKTLGLALAAFLLPAGLASAYDSGRPVIVRSNAAGHVDVVHQVPGGTVDVGVEWGKQPRRPEVVVVQQPPQVVVVEKRREEYRGRNECDREDFREHGHRGRGKHRDREVTVIRREPGRRVTVIENGPARREVTIVKTVPARREVVVVENRHGYDRDGQDRYEYRK